MPHDDPWPPDQQHLRDQVLSGIPLVRREGPPLDVKRMLQYRADDQEPAVTTDPQRLNEIRERARECYRTVWDQSDILRVLVRNDVPWLLWQLTEAHRLNDEAVLVLADRDARNTQLEQARRRAVHLEQELAAAEAKLQAVRDLIKKWMRTSDRVFQERRGVELSDAYSNCAIELRDLLDTPTTQDPPKLATGGVIHHPGPFLVGGGCGISIPPQASPEDTCKPGDPDPTTGTDGDFCGARDDGWLCSRRPHPAGTQHVAVEVDVVTAVWPNQQDGDQT